MEGIIRAVCISEKKGTEKREVPKAVCVEQHGILGDAHAGSWHRQISLLSYDQVKAFNERGGAVKNGDFGENILVEGIDLRHLPVGTHLICNDVELKVTQIGKDCHAHCAIFHRVGDCIMPREGIFAEVLHGGEIAPGDKIYVIQGQSEALTAAVITLSDQGAAGLREDTSGSCAVSMVTAQGYQVVETILLPDEQAELEKTLKRLADQRQVNLILTTGGTGFSERDRTPEATLAVAERIAPGIAEAIRAGSMQYTRRAMLSRGVSVIRGRSLIVNLPGSKKAVEEALGLVLPELEHGIRILNDTASECGR